MIRGFIFDLDGTLLDSTEAWRSLDRRYLKSKGFDEVPPGLHRTLESLGPWDGAAYLKRHYLPHLDEATIIQETNDMIADEYIKRIPLKPGAEALLARYGHLPMCVATACDHDLAQAALERAGVLGHFAFILTTGQVGKDKTRPDLFLRAADRLGLSPGEIAVFEDALHALRTVKGAGFYAVAVADPSGAPHENELRAVADQYISRLDQFVHPV